MNFREAVPLRKNDPKLTELSYEKKGWGPDEVERLSRALTNNTVVKSLRLANNEIGPQGSVSITSILRTNKQIVYIDLSKNQIGTAGAIEIAGGLHENQTLKVLKLNENNIGDEGLANLSRNIPVNGCLTCLELMSNSFGAEGLAALSETLQRGAPRLSSLNLSWNAIDNDGMTFLADGIAGNSNLTSLNLSMCDLTADEVKILAEALQANTSMQSLDLSGNKINWEGAKFLADALIDHPQILSINLKSNSLGDEGMTAIATLLEKKSNLSLNLKFNEIDVPGARALAGAIRRNPSCTRPILRYLSTIKKKLSNESINMNELKLFSYLTDSYVDFDKPEVQRILLGAVYGAGIQQLQEGLFHNEQTYLIPLAMWKVGSRLRLDGFYELIRSKPELLPDVFPPMLVGGQIHSTLYEQNSDGSKR